MNYEIRTSKTELPVPVVNDVLLHSIYDPMREALNFVNSNREQFEEKRKFVVLGLGFGYHVAKMEEVLKEKGKAYQIYVIEPVKKVAKDFIANKPVKFSENVTILTGENIHEFYMNENLINFLLDSPGVIAHPASFNLHKDFFTRFLRHEVGSDSAALLSGINNESIKQYLKENCRTSWGELVHDINLSPNFSNSEDYLVLALSSLAGENPTEQNGGLE